MKQTIFINNKKNTRFIAHRGLSGIETENTLLSFVAAGNRDYWGIECDVHITKDNKYVICHNDETGGLFDKSLLIKSSDFDELRSLKIQDLSNGLLADSIKMPTLSEYLAICDRYNKIAVIELKNPMEMSNIAQIVKICEREYDLTKIVFISFCFENLIKVRELLPKQTVQFLCNEFNEDIFAKVKKHQVDLDTWYGCLTKENISALHGEGIKVNCWTCDDKNIAEELIIFGVDFITTNILE